MKSQINRLLSDFTVLLLAGFITIIAQLGCLPCIDNDGDGYGQNCLPGADCDDADENNWISCATCEDGDGDTHFVGCDAYVSINGWDCDDNDDTASTECPTSDFVEDFDTLDMGVWALADWQLGATQLTSANASTADGLLQLTHNGSEATGYYGAEVYTQQKFGYGEFRARIKGPPETGLICAFFLYIQWDDDGTVKSDETDIELLTSLPEQIWLTLWNNWRESYGYGNGNYHWSETVEPPSYTMSEFNEYGFNWSPLGVTFTLNGATLATIENAVPNAPAPIRFNFWTSTTWTDVGYPPSGDAVCEIDWVTYTPYEP